MKKYSDNLLTDMFDQDLDEQSDSIEICGCKWTASQVLKEMSPRYYDIAFNEFLDYQCSEGYLYESGGEYYDCDPKVHLLEVLNKLDIYREA